MKKTTLLYWSPRIMALIYIVFLSLFALDAFTQDQPLWYSLVGFFIHLIPQISLSVVLLIAWKKPAIGGWLFELSFLVCLWFFGFKNNSVIQLALFSPLLIIGWLFLINPKINQNTV